MIEESSAYLLEKIAKEKSSENASSKIIKGLATGYGMHSLGFGPIPAAIMGAGAAGVLKSPKEKYTGKLNKERVREAAKDIAINLGIPAAVSALFYHAGVTPGKEALKSAAKTGAIIMASDGLIRHFMKNDPNDSNWLSKRYFLSEDVGAKKKK